MAHPYDWEEEQLKIWREHSGLPQGFDYKSAFFQGAFCVPEEEYKDYWAGTDEDLPETEELTEEPGKPGSPWVEVWKKDGYVFMLAM